MFSAFYLFLSLGEYCYLVLIPFSSTNAGKQYRHILKYMNWPHIVRFKKHKAVAHCNNVPNNLAAFRNTWKGVSGIYKITFLPFRLFTYYGSSSDLGARFKYHYFNGAKQSNFLGLFLKVFGWSNFSVTVVEVCPRNKLIDRENWYLSVFNPLLNVLMSSSMDPREINTLSLLTRSKISATLTGRKDSVETRAKMSESQKGAKNPFYGKGPGAKALDIAAEKAGTKVFVYDAKDFILVNGQPFRSLRMVTKIMPISNSTLPSKLDTGKPFKGYYYYTSPQTKAPE